MRLCRRDQQMDVVGHQGVGVKGASFPLQGYTQPVQRGLVVFFAEEAGFAVVPALHDMQRDAIKMDARAAGHGASWLINSTLAPLIWPLICGPFDLRSNPSG